MPLVRVYGLLNTVPCLNELMASLQTAASIHFPDLYAKDVSVVVDRSITMGLEGKIMIFIEGLLNTPERTEAMKIRAMNAVRGAVLIWLENNYSSCRLVQVFLSPTEPAYMSFFRRVGS